MANHEEQKPLMSQDEEEKDIYKGEKEPETKNAEFDDHFNESTMAPLDQPEDVYVAQPEVPQRQPWRTGLFSCMGSSDEFVGSDLEVCVLGLFAPCVLYGSTMERLYPGQSTFSSHCMAYSSLYFMGHFLFNGNFLAPCFSFPSRSALRHSHNLEGCGESLVNATGCCSSLVQDEERLERCESVLDFAAHFCCHQCALCQEGREIRRRTVHPAHRPRYYMTTAPPAQQVMSSSQ
ncbi:hypothetical protein R1flu_003697 [Riccia fluitans]|uniref:PLAC8 family protein n=1 Tax=Riccia fluitans TaxID=41844 RepID=A0ABD1YD56_9MARC